MPRHTHLLLSLLASLVLACGSDGASTAPDAHVEPVYDAWPAPRDNVVPAVGTAATLDIASWNIENFPQQSGTASMVADLITSMQLDLLGVQEIESIAAFDEVVARLPNHEGVLSTHTYGNGTYQKLGFIYDTRVVELSNAALIFQNEGYIFPRPPLRAEARVVSNGTTLDFIIIVVHLKAGFDFQDRQRRDDAVTMLEGYVRGVVDGSGQDVVILGDFNEVITSSAGIAVMEPWLDDAARYRVHTRTLASSGSFTFIPSQAILDHVVTTTTLDDELGSATGVIPRLDQQLSQYRNLVSDHLPVVLGIPLQ